MENTTQAINESAVRILQDAADRVAANGGGGHEASQALSILFSASNYLIMGKPWRA